MKERMKRKYILMGVAILSSVVAGAQDITDSIARKTQAVSTIWVATGTVSHAADGVDRRCSYSFARI